MEEGFDNEGDGPKVAGEKMISHSKWHLRRTRFNKYLIDNFEHLSGGYRTCNKNYWIALLPPVLNVFFSVAMIVRGENWMALCWMWTYDPRSHNPKKKAILAVLDQARGSSSPHSRVLQPLRILVDHAFHPPSPMSTHWASPNPRLCPIIQTIIFSGLKNKYNAPADSRCWLGSS